MSSFGSIDDYEIVKRIGRRIFLLRDASKISLEELAFSIGISQQQLHEYEIGKEKITVDQLVRIAEVLNLKMISFFPIEDVGEKIGMPLVHIERDYEILEHLAQFRKLSGKELIDKFVNLMISETNS